MMETIILYLYHIQIHFGEEGPQKPVKESDPLQNAKDHYVEENGETSISPDTNQ